MSPINEPLHGDARQERRALLARGVGMLSTLDYCRERLNKPEFGMDVEKGLLDAALLDIERQTYLLEVDEMLERKQRSSLGQGE